MLTGEIELSATGSGSRSSRWPPALRIRARIFRRRRTGSARCSRFMKRLLNSLPQCGVVSSDTRIIKTAQHPATDISRLTYRAAAHGEIALEGFFFDDQYVPIRGLIRNSA